MTNISGDFVRDVVLYARWITIYDVHDGVIVGYNYEMGDDVVIPNEIDGERIVGIAEGVLENARRVEILAGLLEIGADMFAGCNVLKELIMPDTIERIDCGALKDCESLTALTVPYIGLEKFDGNDGTYYTGGT